MLRRLLATALLGSVFGAPAAAQFAVLPNTGCGPTVNIIKWAGSGRLGTLLDVKSACSTTREAPILLLGGRTLPLPLMPPLSCVGICAIEVNPWTEIVGTAGSAYSSLVVPNVSTLVGSVLRYQGVCLDRPQLCVTFTQAIEVTIN